MMGFLALVFGLVALALLVNIRQAKDEEEYQLEKERAAPYNRVIEYGDAIYATFKGHIYKYQEDKGWDRVPYLPEGLTRKDGQLMPAPVVGTFKKNDDRVWLDL